MLDVFEKTDNKFKKRRRIIWRENLTAFVFFFVVIIANLIGGVLPLLASSLKQDPASMSGPILTTVCDAISLTIYFTLATIFLGGI